jgi:flavin-dependent dehydrogenase
MRRHDAIVIGAGPAGSTAARLLAAAGWSVALVEKSEFPRRKVCGEFLSATNLPLLRDALGQGFEAAAGPPVKRVALYAGHHQIIAPMPVAPGLGWGRALGRGPLDLALRDAAVAAGAALWQPWKLTATARDGADHVCTLTSGDKQEDMRAPVLIAAQGSWEPGPLTQARAHAPGDMLAFKAHFTGGSLSDDLMPLLAFAGGYGGLVHSDGGRLSLSGCIRRDVLADLRGAGVTAGAAFQAHVMRHCDGARAALANALPDGVWLAAGPIRPGVRVPAPDGVYRIGNAAGEAHPIIAEGISMAMQSAWILARHLIAGNAAAYESEWRAHFAPRIRAAALFAALAMRPVTAAPIAALVAQFPAILTWGARRSGKSAVLADFDKPHRG